MPLSIRLATVSDIDAINDIYNPYVRTSTCTYDLEPWDRAQRAAWLEAHGEAHPATVAWDGETRVGFGALSGFRGRAGYKFTVENAVYVHPDHHRRGVGRAILADLVVRARALGHRAIVAGISADQSASVSLHERFGFERVGLLPAVGFKFDRWLDLLFMQLALTP